MVTHCALWALAYQTVTRQQKNLEMGILDRHLELPVDKCTGGLQFGSGHQPLWRGRGGGSGRGGGGGGGQSKNFLLLGGHF